MNKHKEKLFIFQTKIYLFILFFTWHYANDYSIDATFLIRHNGHGELLIKSLSSDFHLYLEV